MRSMRHLSTAAALLAIGVVASACSNGYYVNLAEFRQRHATVVQQQRPAKRLPAHTVPATVSESQGKTTAATGNELKPWPKRGTPEAEQLEAEEIEREQRINQLIH